MKWISIKERLPEKEDINIYYLTWGQLIKTNQPDICLQTYYNEDWNCVHNSSNEFYAPCYVMFWIPLPKSPKENKDNE